MPRNVLEEDIRILCDRIDALGLGGSSVLVTGATGMIGSMLVKAFSAYNHAHGTPVKVTALVRNREKVQAVFGARFDEENPHVSFRTWDACQPVEGVPDCDYVIHTANATSSRYFMSNPAEVLDSIYQGTRNILEYARSCAAKGVVYLSSMEVFGRVDSDERIGEDDLGQINLQNIRSCYPEGKRVAEYMCKAYAAEFGLPVRIARLAQTFGAGVLPNDQRVFMQFATSVMHGENIVLHTDGRSMGNYCYTRDAISAILLLLVSGEAGEAYTVVNEQTTMTIADMAQLVIDHFSKGSSEIIFDIPTGNTYGYAPRTGMKLSAAKLRQLGWKPEVGLVEMYARLIDDLGQALREEK